MKLLYSLILCRKSIFPFFFAVYLRLRHSVAFVVHVQAYMFLIKQYEAELIMWRAVAFCSIWDDIFHYFLNFFGKKLTKCAVFSLFFSDRRSRVASFRRNSFKHKVTQAGPISTGIFNILFRLSFAHLSQKAAFSFIHEILVETLKMQIHYPRLRL